MREAEQVARRRRKAKGSNASVRPSTRHAEPGTISDAWIDASPAFFARLDAKGRVLQVNRALLGALGCSAESVKGADFVAAALSEGERHRVARVFALAAQNGQPFLTVAELGGVERRGCRVEWHGGPVLGPDGGFEGITVVGVGLERVGRGDGKQAGDEQAVPLGGGAGLREIQERLIDAERLGAAGDLAACVAHAVGNPLAALLGTAQMAYEASRVQDPVLHRIVRLGQRIQRVVDRTLQLFREEELSLGEEDPGQILTDAAEELTARATGQGVQVSVHIEPDLAPIRADRKLLSGALVRVGENALEAMHGHGRLELEVFALSHLEGVTFRISDTGPGFSELARKRAFEPFFTTKGGTSGLGLPIARGVVMGHQGRIQLEGRAGGGSIVSIELPARPGVLL